LLIENYVDEDTALGDNQFLRPIQCEEAGFGMTKGFGRRELEVTHGFELKDESEGGSA